MLRKIDAREITQVAAAKQLKLSTRHLRRLMPLYKAKGQEGLRPKHTSPRVSNNRISDQVRQEVLQLLKTRYHDFKPTFAHEKLTEQHGFTFSVEWLRQFMMEHQLWKGQPTRVGHIHQSRTRRPALGELVQIDGSHHNWFEDRAPPCCLIVFVDDATGAIMALNFAEQETTQAYFQACEKHFAQHGRPLSYYSDKHSIFRVNIKEAQSGNGETQFGRAMRELGIELICANTPQAKGRVERMNSTLQDRLIKEMRLRGISTIPTANNFLPHFIEDYNRKFPVQPAHSHNAHRQALPNDDALNLIFSEQSTRKLSSQLQFSYKNVIYQIQTNKPSLSMRRANVTVCERDNNISVFYKQHLLDYTTIDKNNQPTPIKNKKVAIPNRKQTKPSPDHPWRKSPIGSYRRDRPPPPKS